MLLKKFRHEKFEMGSDGMLLIGMPNSSTSGCCGSVKEGFWLSETEVIWGERR